MTFTHIKYNDLLSSQEGHYELRPFPEYGHDCFEVVYFCKPFTHNIKTRATVYGVSLSEISINWPVERKIPLWKAFSFPVYGNDSDRDVIVDGRGLFIIKRGYLGQSVVTGIEEEGRLSYIDGCTDSVLVYPPRKGDPCLNSLYFPRRTEQTMHTHPTSRVGMIVGGHGLADLGHETVELSYGDMFIIPPNCKHRFITEDSKMSVIAWHPDSDWGPEDHNHPMLNRTFLK